MRRPTFEELTFLEPQLETLRAQAQGVGCRTHGTRMWRDWERIKQRLGTLVGWNASHPALASEACYEVAIDAILETFEVAAARAIRRRRRA